MAAHNNAFFPVHYASPKESQMDYELACRHNQSNIARPIYLNQHEMYLEPSVWLSQSTVEPETLAFDICDGLIYLDEYCNTHHNQLTPSRILVTPNNRCKIFLTHKSYEPNCCMYSAPEQLLNKNKGTIKSDIWALAVIIAERLLGTTLFTETTPLELFTQQLTLSGISEDTIVQNTVSQVNMKSNIRQTFQVWPAWIPFFEHSFHIKPEHRASLRALGDLIPHL
uniref:Protein kinase domain-containing protein n=1 Tax=Ranid herpesvirus 4 TaxID=2849006 RepID=A0A8F3HSP5_9VIRU|nr:MAG: hypothetical protein [Ranid herpesvirus 4]